MNTPRPSSDPLLRILTDETAEMPLRAASEARKRIARRRKNRQHATLVSVAALLGIVTWNALYSIRKPITDPPMSGELANQHAVSPPVFQTLPTGLDPEQLAFVKAAGDMPLLLVRNSSGKVIRIHLVER